MGTKDKGKTEKISINLSRSWIATLRRLAHEKSLETGREICYTDLIREAIQKSRN